MGLRAQIIRDDQPQTIRWGWWHVECMTRVLRAEDSTVEDQPLLEAWSHNRTPGRHTVQYAVGFRDPLDGEVLIFEPGDVLNVWRDR